LHFAHNDFLHIAKHPLLLHAWRMLFGNSLPLLSQRLSLPGIIFDLVLDVFLIAFMVLETLSTPFDVIVLLVKPLHL
jgi:hypothetical protein